MDLPFVYSVIVVLIVLCLLFPKSKGLQFTTIAYLAFLAIFRSVSVGTDYEFYVYDFQKYMPGKVEYEWERTETGFMMLIYWFRSICNSYVVFYGLLYAIFQYGVLKLAKVRGVALPWVLFAYFFFGFYFRSLNGVRQFFAIGAVLLATPFLYSRQYKKFAIVTLLISLLFHHSCIIMLLLLPLHYYANKTIALNKSLLYVVIVLSYLFFFVGRNFLYSWFQPLENLVMLDNYAHYVMNGEYREDISNITSTVYTIYAMIIVYCSKNNNYRFELLAVVLSFVIFNVASIMAVAMGRLFLNFNIFLCVLIPLFIQGRMDFKKVLFLVSTLCVSFSTFYVQFIAGNNSEVKPYLFIFSI